MYPSSFDYKRATSVAEAAAMLQSHPGAKMLAGGHSLIPLLKLRLAAPSMLVDIGRIARAARHQRRGGVAAHRRVDDACRARGIAGRARAGRGAGRSRRATSAIQPCATAAPSAAMSRTRIRRPICRPC